MSLFAEATPLPSALLPPTPAPVSPEQIWDPAETAAILPVDINTASAAELAELPDLGLQKAEAIVNYRKAHGPFQRVADLQHVKGIGPAFLRKNAHRLVASWDPVSASEMTPEEALQSPKTNP